MKVNVIKNKLTWIRGKQNIVCYFLIIVLLVLCVVLRYQNAVLLSKLNEYEVSFPLGSRNIGEIYDTKQFSFSISSVSYDPQGIPELPAPPGMEYMVVSYSLHNKLYRESAFLPVFETVVIGESGEEYQVTAAPSITMDSAAGNIPSGVAVSGELGFLVPNNNTKLVFRYEPRAFPNTNTILYDIYR